MGFLLYCQWICFLLCRLNHNDMPAQYVYGKPNSYNKSLKKIRLELVSCPLVKRTYCCINRRFHEDFIHDTGWQYKIIIYWQTIIRSRILYASIKIQRVFFVTVSIIKVHTAVQSQWHQRWMDSGGFEQYI